MIYIFNKLPLKNNRLACKKQIGYVPDSPDMFLTLSAFEYWSLVASIYEIDNKQEMIFLIGTANYLI